MTPKLQAMLESTLNRILKHKVIVNCDRGPYLLRWYLFRSKRVAIFLHKFVKSDEDRALHDHPWNFLVVPVWRGYIEHSDRPWKTGDGCPFGRDYLGNPAIVKERVDVKRRVWPFLGTRFRRGEYRHRVELIEGKPSWSIFFRFTERRVWGFWPTEGFQAWNKWWQDKCE